MDKRKGLIALGAMPTALECFYCGGSVARHEHFCTWAAQSEHPDGHHWYEMSPRPYDHFRFRCHYCGYETETKIGGPTAKGNGRPECRPPCHGDDGWLPPRFVESKEQAPKKTAWERLLSDEGE